MTTEIQPCSTCGTKAHVTTTPDESFGKRYAVISDSGAKCYKEKNILFACRTEFRENREEAIQDWNSGERI